MKEIDLNKINMYGAADVFYMTYNGINIASANYRSKFAYPFMIEDETILIGGAGETHGPLSKKIKGSKEILFGRIWANIKSDGTFNEIFNGYSILVFWNCFTDMKVVSGILMDELFTKLGVDRNHVILARFDDWFGHSATLEMYRGGDITLSEMTPGQKEQYTLHLMNAHDKHDATSDFRKTRDERIGKKLTNDNGVEMPVAQYRSMVYAEGKKIKSIIRNVLKEYIYKDRKIIIF